MALKRHILLIAFLICSALAAEAQKLGGGLLAGMSLSTMQIAGNDSTRFKPGFTGGFRIALIPTHSVFGVEAEIVYSQGGYGSKRAIDSIGNKVSYGARSHYLEMPILLNVYMRKWKDTDESEAKMLRLRVGPEIGVCIAGSDLHNIKGKTKKQEITPWENGTFNRFHYGVTAAVAYWFIEVRYTYGISNVMKGTTPSHNHVISILFSDIW